MSIFLISPLRGIEHVMLLVQVMHSHLTHAIVTHRRLAADRIRRHRRFQIHRRTYKPFREIKFVKADGTAQRILFILLLLVNLLLPRIGICLR